MVKQRMALEYELRSRSFATIWGLVSTPEGMQRWIADKVTRTDDTLTFTWGNEWEAHQTKSARILSCEKTGRFRFRWDGDGEQEYVELRIERSALTGDYVLHVTDFAEPDDMDDMRGLWDGDVKRLHQNTGV